jgi:transposase
MESYQVERIDHLGIVAGVCQEIGLVEYFDALDDQTHAHVSLGQAVLAMVLNGLGFSNRRLYLVPQFFQHKPVERLIGPGITADDRNDDCLGRALDWLTAHDLTALFAGMAYQARRRFAVAAPVVHVDTTSFAVEGDYAAGAEPCEDATLIRITYGYSRDHRDDLKQWQLSLATTTSGVPIGLQLLAGNASDKVTLAQQIDEVVFQLRADHEDEPIYVADSAVYSEPRMTELEQHGVHWLSRVPETSTAAKALVAEDQVVWEGTETLRWYERMVPVGERSERWIVVQSTEGLAHPLATMQRRAEREREAWEQRIRSLEQRKFACEADAQTALSELALQIPPWLEGDLHIERIERHARPGRPRKGALPEHSHFVLRGTVHVIEAAVRAEAWRKAKFIVATNVPATQHRAEELIALYKGQSGVERGFGFLKDPLFLASSVFVKKTERVMATGFIMVLCLLVYRLAEHRIRQRLAESGERVPDQVNKLTQRPTMRWLFPCFEGLSIVLVQLEDHRREQHVTGVTDLHRQILRLLGPLYEQFYFSSN